MTRFIFTTGGVTSSLGKGLAAASLASLLQERGFRVKLRKLDPYLNVDPGTMSPYQHGEVFVTDDGAETDLDLGHYERFTNTSASKSDYTTTGQIYSNVINKERRGDYLGATIQIIPHITDEIKAFIQNDVEDTDFVFCEVGGTVGDIEGLPYLEAMRQLRNELGASRTLFLHLTYIPYLQASGELKTKPTQHSVKELLSVGIQADILLCRCEKTLSDEIRQKISQFCNVPFGRVLPALDADSIYRVPLQYRQAGLDQAVCDFFQLNAPQPKQSNWEPIVEHLDGNYPTVDVAVVGKYAALTDADKSLRESIIHAGFANKAKVRVTWIHAEDIDAINDVLPTMQGLIIPGGFGIRGTEGKIHAIKLAREQKIPALGICLGMQLMLVEGSHNLLNWKDAHSLEFQETDKPIVGFMENWVNSDGSTSERTESGQMGGTMRVGAYPCAITPNTLAERIYGSKTITERHRHRFEVNPNYREDFEKVGYVFSGLSPDERLAEIVERNDHPFFMGVQFHPELKSRPLSPHPIFAAWLKASLNKKN